LKELGRTTYEISVSLGPGTLTMKQYLRVQNARYPKKTTERKDS